MDDPRRAIASTDALLADPRLDDACRRLGRTAVVEVVRRAQALCREGRIEPGQVLDQALRLSPAYATSLRQVVNATGVVVHTNLGRAPLSDAARSALQVAAGTTNVELDLETGRRGQRGRATLDALGAAVPEAEAVHVVNNGAAALALAAAVLAGGKQIVVARGEMVEIGDGFRIPELLEATGARLREVGTTNRASLADYAAAIGDDTGFVLKVHPSNFVVTGFTASVPASELASLPVPVVVDIGSGLLRRHPRLPDEPDAASALRAGAALVTASGDKLLGGPQCGLMLGAAPLVERLRRHPLARAYRVDKLTLAALEATLTGPPTPVVRALEADTAALRARATALVEALSGIVEAEVVDTVAAVGGGGAPGVELPSAAVSLPETFAAPLRLGEPSVVGRVRRDRLLLDLIAVEPSDDAALADAVRRTAKTLDEVS